MMNHRGVYVIPNFSRCTQVQNKCKTVSEALLQNAHRSFSIKQNPGNCELHAMSRRFNLIWKDCSFVSKIRYNFFLNERQFMESKSSKRSFAHQR